jgi:hypothetical protein
MFVVINPHSAIQNPQSLFILSILSILFESALSQLLASVFVRLSNEYASVHLSLTIGVDDRNMAHPDH